MAFRDAGAHSEDDDQIERVTLAGLRRRLDKTQKEVGRGLGITQPSVAKIEHDGTWDLKVARLANYVRFGLKGDLVLMVKIGKKRYYLR